MYIYEVWTKVSTFVVIVVQHWQFQSARFHALWVLSSAEAFPSKVEIGQWFLAQLQSEECHFYLFCTPVFCIQFHVKSAKDPKYKKVNWCSEITIANIPIRWMRKHLPEVCCFTHRRPVLLAIFGLISLNFCRWLLWRFPGQLINYAADMTLGK